MADCTLVNFYEVHDQTGSVITVPSVVVGAGQSLIVKVLMNPSASQTINSVKWNTTEDIVLVSGLARSFILSAPTATTASVVVTLSAAPTGRCAVSVEVVSNYGGVRGVATGTTAVLTQTLTTVSGDYCTAGLTSSFGDTNDLDVVAGTNQLLKATNLVGGNSAAIDVYSAWKRATSTSTSMGWQIVTADSNRTRKSEWIVIQGTSLTANTIAKQAGDNQAAQKGTAVSSALQVKVSDSGAGGAGVPGYNVTFVIASGGGSFGGTATVATDSGGIATAPAWTLGASAGVNTVTVTDAALSGSPVTFTAFGTDNPIGGTGGRRLINGSLIQSVSRS